MSFVNLCFECWCYSEYDKFDDCVGIIVGLYIITTKFGKCDKFLNQKGSLSLDNCKDTKPNLVVIVYNNRQLYVITGLITFTIFL